MARLLLREFLGPILRLHAALPDGTPIRVAVLGGQATPQRTPQTADGTLRLAYDPAQITLYPAP